MRIAKLSIKNFRSIKSVENISIGRITAFIGRNDVGKSNILYALKLFFEDQKVEEEDLFLLRGETEDFIEIAVSFTDLPDQIELEENVPTTFAEENLLDDKGFLTIIKRFRVGKKTPEVYLEVLDYEDDDFCALYMKKESDLNSLLSRLGFIAKKAGRSITNKEKRAKIRKIAEQKGIKKKLRRIKIGSKTYEALRKCLPELVFYASNMPIDPTASSFQNEFKPLIDEALRRNEELYNKLEEETRKTLQGEINKIFEHYKRYVSDVRELKVKHSLQMKKALNFDVIAVDNQGVETSFTRRGTGSRRLLMLAFLQYLVSKSNHEDSDDRVKYIFAIEEPEAFLHPSLQRELIGAFQQLIELGYQILITTHSPVFASCIDVNNLKLVRRVNGETVVIDDVEDLLDKIADELGVEPRDQIISFSGVVYVEGVTDVEFFMEIARKFKEAEKIKCDFDDKGIGFINMGGNNLKTFVERISLKKLNKRFAVIIDSDKKSPKDGLKQRILNYKIKVENDGGIFIVLRKREIENYIHPATILRKHGVQDNCKNQLKQLIEKFKSVDREQFVQIREREWDYKDIKELCGMNVYKLVRDMSVEEILEMDLYIKDGQEHHELLEIIETLLDMV